MLVEFSPGFVVDMKMIFRHNFGAPFLTGRTDCIENRQQTQLWDIILIDDFLRIVQQCSSTEKSHSDPNKSSKVKRFAKITG